MSSSWPMVHLGDRLDSNCCPSHLRRCGSDDEITPQDSRNRVAFYPRPAGLTRLDGVADAMDRGPPGPGGSPLAYGRAGPARSARGERRVAIGLDRLGMRLAKDRDRTTIIMAFSESPCTRIHIIERVETFVRHPVFAGSDRAMDLVLDDLESLERAARSASDLPEAPRMILRSPHIVSCR